MPNVIPRNACAVCGKGRMQRNLVSHAKNTAIRYAQPNLRRIRGVIRGEFRNALVCAKCLKKGSVVPALPRRLARALAPSA